MLTGLKNNHFLHQTTIIKKIITLNTFKIINWKLSLPCKPFCMDILRTTHGNFYGQGNQESFQHEKMLDWPWIEPVTLNTVLLNTHLIIALAIWTLNYFIKLFNFPKTLVPTWLTSVEISFLVNCNHSKEKKNISSQGGSVVESFLPVCRVFKSSISTIFPGKVTSQLKRGECHRKSDNETDIDTVHYAGISVYASERWAARSP